MSQPLDARTQADRRHGNSQADFGCFLGVADDRLPFLGFKETEREITHVADRAQQAHQSKAQNEQRNHGPPFGCVGGLGRLAVIDDAHERNDNQHAKITYEFGNRRDIERLRIVVVLLINKARTGYLCRLMHGGAKEQSSAERIGIEHPMRRKWVGQHRDDAEQSDACNRVSNLVVLRSNSGRRCNDGCGATNAGADRDQCSEPGSQAELAAQKRNDQ